ncbi:MAG: hypothetical protein JO263_02315 [Candidatus Eremiobacteraeota bacterium]|nr:hypothetical protein [Candidatus Eremiobacteraeota bacterium]
MARLVVRSGTLASCALALAIAGCGGSQSGSPGGSIPSPPPPSVSPIRHVVVVVQENRSFDNLFALFPGADGATRGKMKVLEHGRYVDRWTPLTPQPLIIGSDIQHCHASFLRSYDGGAMDGFSITRFGVCLIPGKPVGRFVYQYVRQSDIRPYWDIAKRWTLADHFFQSQGSGSFTAHQDLIRGSTNINSTESLIDTPTDPPWGCDAPPGTVTSLITSAGKYLKGQGPFPCSDRFPSPAYYATIRDRLDASGVSWKYYAPCFSAADGCTPAKSCPHCAGDLLNPFDMIVPVRAGHEWSTNVSMPETNIFTDLENGALPAVSWVIPEDDEDDHPGEPIDKGPSWVASVVNAIGQSQFWKSTTIIVLWDDWGGFFDHVAPVQFTDKFGGLGFRVPCLIVSPYAIAGQGSEGGRVSHTQYEFGSILRYIEDNFRLGRLHTTDTRANSIGDVFDYNASPRAFAPIASQYSIRYFEKRRHRVQRGDPE